jgi:probable HAF family extracellular repeat protein
MRARHLFPLFLLTLSVGLASAAAPEYRITVVGPANSVAADINNAGVVVGNYPFSPTATRAFLNRGAGLVDLGAGTEAAVAINDKGQVIGHWTRGGQQRGFIYAGGKVRDIGVIPGRGTSYTDINNAGYVTAFGTLAGTYEGPHAFVRSPCGTFRDIGSLLPYENPMTAGFSINNHNQVAGYSGPLVFPDQPLRAIIWEKGTMRDLGDLGIDPNSAQAINDRGQITGYASLLTGFRDEVAFVWSHGRMINIDGRPDTTDRFSAGTAINNHGHVVGTSDHLSGFLYRGRRMESLNALVDAKLGWDVHTPKGINDAGQIAADASRKGVRYAVRLDLIRPMSERIPDLGVMEVAEPEKCKVEAELDAGTAAREVARPVQQ